MDILTPKTKPIQQKNIQKKEKANMKREIDLPYNKADIDYGGG